MYFFSPSPEPFENVASCWNIRNVVKWMIKILCSVLYLQVWVVLGRRLNIRHVCIIFVCFVISACVSVLLLIRWAVFLLWSCGDAQTWGVLHLFMLCRLHSLFASRNCRNCSLLTLSGGLIMLCGCSADCLVFAIQYSVPLKTCQCRSERWRNTTLETKKFINR